MENETLNVANLRLFCTDPREGRAMVEIVKPSKPGRTFPNDSRRTIGVGYIEVDPTAAPLIAYNNANPVASAIRRSAVSMPSAASRRTRWADALIAGCARSYSSIASSPL